MLGRVEVKEGVHCCASGAEAAMQEARWVQDLASCVRRQSSTWAVLVGAAAEGQASLACRSGEEVIHADCLACGPSRCRTGSISEEAAEVQAGTPAPQVADIVPGAAQAAGASASLPSTVMCEARGCARLSDHDSLPVAGCEAVAYARMT